MTVLAEVATAGGVGIAARLARLDRAAQAAQWAAWWQWRATGRLVPAWRPRWAWSSAFPGASMGAQPRRVEAAPAALVSLACRLEGRAADSAPEAEFLVGVHNELHHGARPVAASRPGCAGRAG